MGYFSHNIHTNQRTKKGHLVLDLRSLPLPDQIQDLQRETISSIQPKWYPVLNTTYNKQLNLNPELLIQLSIEQDCAEEDENENIEQEQSSPVKSPSGKQSFIQIGDPNRKDQEKFTFILQLTDLTNIHDVINANAHIALQPSANLFLYTNIFGRELKFREFSLQNNRDPSMVEIAKIKLRANIHDLQENLKNQPPLQIHLCCGDHSLGAAEINCGNFVNSSGSAKVEGHFRITPPLKALQNTAVSDIKTKLHIEATLQKGNLPFQEIQRQAERSVSEQKSSPIANSQIEEPFRETECSKFTGS